MSNVFTFAQLREIAAEVARRLSGYTLAPYDPSRADSDNFTDESCRIVRIEALNEGQAMSLMYVIRLRLIGFQRFEVEGYWPTSKLNPDKLYPDEKERTKGITIALADAEKVAAEIQRRFLPNYEMDFKKASEGLARDDADELEARAIAADLAAWGNGSLDPSCPSRFRGGKADAGSFQGHVRLDRGVEFHFVGLTAPMELQIIQLVGEQAVERAEQRDWSASDLKIRRVPADTAREIMALFGRGSAPDVSPKQMSQSS